MVQIRAEVSEDDKIVEFDNVREIIDCRDQTPQSVMVRHREDRQTENRSLAPSVCVAHCTCDRGSRLAPTRESH